MGNSCSYIVVYNELFQYSVHRHDVNGIDLWKATQAMSIFRFPTGVFVFNDM